MEVQQNQHIPKGSVAVGRRAKLPAGAEEPITVFINGVAQEEGVDYVLEGGEIVFNRQILKEAKSRRNKMVMLLGVVGIYHKDETVDIQFSRDGKTEFASDLEIHQ